MHILRRLSIGLFSLLCVTAIGLLAYLGALQMTVLNRTTVKSWIADSGVYKNNLIPSLVQSGASKAEKPDPATATGSLQIPPDAIKFALERTFTGDYVRSKVDDTIDKFYDYLEGKSSQFVLVISISDRRDAFISSLAKASEHYVAALPTCTPGLPANTLCRPANIAPDLYAEQIITRNVEESGFFKRPLTTGDGDNGLRLPRVLSATTPIMIGLAILAIVSATLYLWLTPIANRLNAISKLGKRIFFGQIFTFVASLLLVAAFYFGIFKLPMSLPDQPAVVTATVTNIVKIALMSVAGHLAVITGIICIIGLGVWIGFNKWKNKATQVSVVDTNTLKY